MKYVRNLSSRPLELVGIQTVRIPSREEVPLDDRTLEQFEAQIEGLLVRGDIQVRDDRDEEKES